MGEDACDKVARRYKGECEDAIKAEYFAKKRLVDFLLKHGSRYCPKTESSSQMILAAKSIFMLSIKRIQAQRERQFDIATNINYEDDSLLMLLLGVETGDVAHFRRDLRVLRPLISVSAR